MNLSVLIKLQSAWSTFKNNHPKFPLFLKTVSKHGLEPETIIEIQVKSPDGTSFQSNIKLTESDLELFNELKQLLK